MIYVLARMGRTEQAVDEFREIYDQGFSRAYLFHGHGVMDDPDGIYNGLGSDPEFLAMMEDIETRNAAWRADVEENAPWLFDTSKLSPRMAEILGIEAERQQDTGG